MGGLVFFAMAGVSLACSDYEGSPQVAMSPGPELPDAGYRAAPAAFEYVSYPAPPYGTVSGATLENLAFLGWRSPRDYQMSCNSRNAPPPLEPISFGDFFDPDGSKDIELVMLNVSAVWCSVCRSEFRLFQQQQTHATYRARGVEFIGVLFEDANHEPARPTDLACWSHAFEVSFPMLLDPAFKTGRYFSSDATPMNLVIDARSMKILALYPGGGGAIDDMMAYIDRTLARRGR
jgi:hypothetical protein